MESGVGMNEVTIDELDDWIGQPGVTDVQEKGDAGFVCIYRYMYTHAILSGLERSTYDGRWCYKDYDAAKTALDAWDGKEGTEPSGWHRHPGSGRRRDEHGNETVMF
jgi:hypothetical protein